MSDYSSDAHWRDAARPARFFMIDYRAAFPLLLFLLHISWWTFSLAFGAMVFFGILERFGFKFRVFVYRIRTLVAGHRKMAIPWWKE